MEIAKRESGKFVFPDFLADMKYQTNDGRMFFQHGEIIVERINGSAHVVSPETWRELDAAARRRK